MLIYLTGMNGALKVNMILANVNTDLGAIHLKLSLRNVTESLIDLKYKYNSSLKRLEALVIATANAKLPRTLIVGETGTNTVAAAVRSSSAQFFATRRSSTGSDAYYLACSAKSANSAAVAEF